MSAQKRTNDNMDNNITIESNKLGDLLEKLSILNQIIYQNHDLFYCDNARILNDTLPDYLLVGNQSSSKSSIVTRCVRNVAPSINFELYTSNGCATKYPIHIIFKRGNVEQIKYSLIESSNERHDFADMSELNNITKDKKLEDFVGCIVEIIVIGPNADSLTITDMPGLKAIGIDDYEKGEKAYIEKLLSDRIILKNSIVIHVINSSADISNTSSFTFVRDILKVPNSNQIIVASNLDLTFAKQNGISERLVEYAKEFKGMKLFCVQAKDKDGFIDSNTEMNNLNKMNIKHPDLDIHLGIDNLCQEICSRLNDFVITKKHEILPCIKLLQQFCSNQLVIIGEVPKSQSSIAHDWILYVRDSCKRALIDERSLFNDMMVKSRAINFDIVCDSEYIKNVIIESKRNRGEQKEELISIDAPIKAVIKKHGADLIENINKFNNDFHIQLSAMIEALIVDIRGQLPSCDKLTALLRLKWMELFENLWQQYTAGCVDKITQATNNSEGFSGFNLINMYTLVAIEQYNRSSNRSDSLQDFQKHIITNIKSTTSLQIDIDIVKRYVLQFWNDLKHIISNTMPTAISYLAKQINADFNDYFIVDISNEHMKTIHENEKIVNKRRILIEVRGISDHIIKHY